jgi:hypothetical protein
MNLFCRTAALLVFAGAFAGVVSVQAADAPAPKADAPKKDPKDMSLDELVAAELCPVTRLPAKPIYHVTIGDKRYTFATKDARKEFEANPEKFGAKKIAKAEPKPEAKPAESKKEAKPKDEAPGEMKM